jgi:hypothetical protein
MAMFFSIASFVYASNADNMETFEEQFNRNFPDVLFEDIYTFATVELNYNVDEKHNIKIDGNFIPLETISGERYAFLIPLVNGRQFIGYMVMGAVDGNYLMLELSFSDPKFTNHIIEESQKNTIIYKFPSGFITKEDNEYFLISHNLKKHNISHSISDYSTAVIHMLTERNEFDFQPSSLYESVGLTNWQNFTPVYFGTTTYYGGYQDWLGPNYYGFVSQFWADRSCGVTAAANAAYHMSVYKSGMGNLYNRTSLSRYQFTLHMYDVYEYISPAIYGIPDINTMASRFKAFASSRNVNLNGVFWNVPWNIVNVSNYIKSGLSINSPVLLVTWNTSIPDLAYHWVTITRYHRTDAGDRYFTASNWASRRVYNLDVWVNESGLYRGVIYFN